MLKAGNAAILEAIVDSEESQLRFADLRDDQRNSAAEKQSNALKHMNTFLRECSTQTKKPFVPAAQLTCEPTEENMKEWDNMIGCFFSHLAKEARQRCNRSREQLSCNSATGYASAVKAYYTNKW